MRERRDPPRPASAATVVPERVVLCFFLEAIEEVCGDGKAEPVARFTGSTERTLFTPSTRRMVESESSIPG
jgi:hypothetical protein